MQRDLLFLISEIEEMIRFVKEINSDVVVFVDNCYGEFVEDIEPCHVGADLMAGSLIKNPGGGLVKTGGYIVGKAKMGRGLFVSTNFTRNWCGSGCISL